MNRDRLMVVLAGKVGREVSECEGDCGLRLWIDMTGLPYAEVTTKRVVKTRFG